MIEFFWYGCPHCNAFEPMLDAWQKQLPADVAFRRVPALGIQGLYYTSGALAGGNDRVLAVADYLIQQSRKRG